MSGTCGYKTVRFNKSMDVLQKTTEQIAEEQARFIDQTIAEHVPQWKLSLLRKFQYPLLARILFVNVEVEHSTLVANFGKEVRVKLNGKVIGSRKYSL